MITLEHPDNKWTAQVKMPFAGIDMTTSGETPLEAVNELAFDFAQFLFKNYMLDYECLYTPGETELSILAENLCRAREDGFDLNVVGADWDGCATASQEELLDHFLAWKQYPISISVTKWGHEEPAILSLGYYFHEDRRDHTRVECRPMLTIGDDDGWEVQIEAQGFTDLYIYLSGAFCRRLLNDAADCRENRQC